MASRNVHRRSADRYDLSRDQAVPGRPESAALADERASVETYASTLSSQEDVDHYDTLIDPTPTVEDGGRLPQALPATPSDFAVLFPSSRTLAIRHDQSTDGHLNLRVDTDVEMMSGRVRRMTLFHLRMYDVRTREFSLRRYCRDSGREVCRSFPKRPEASNVRRPVLQRSMTSAFAALRTMSELKAPAVSGVERQDSGYGSVDVRAPDHDSRPSSAGDDMHDDPSTIVPTDVIRLEFSNYAHVDVKRRSTRKHNRYDFEFWGRRYAWKRGKASHEESTFYLCRPKAEADRPIAEIVLDRLTAEDVEDEQSNDSWVPPSSLRITDLDAAKGLTDVSDVIVATGLIALVDDSVKQNLDLTHHKQTLLPFRANLDYNGPKQMAAERSSQPSNASRTTSNRRPGTPRRISARA